MPSAHDPGPGRDRDRAGPREQIESIRRSLVTLRRLFQRKELAALWAAAFGGRARLDYGELRLLDAVEVARALGPGRATVGEVSRQLGVDPSRASRQVAAAVAGGLLARVATQGDARVVVLEITPRGARLQARGAELTRSRIALALRGWSAADRALLATLLERFVTRL